MGGARPDIAGIDHRRRLPGQQFELTGGGAPDHPGHLRRPATGRQRPGPGADRQHTYLAVRGASRSRRRGEGREQAHDHGGHQQPELHHRSLCPATVTAGLGRAGAGATEAPVGRASPGGRVRRWRRPPGSSGGVVHRGPAVLLGGALDGVQHQLGPKPSAKEGSGWRDSLMAMSKSTHSCTKLWSQPSMWPGGHQ